MMAGIFSLVLSSTSGALSATGSAPTVPDLMAFMLTTRAGLLNAKRSTRSTQLIFFLKVIKEGEQRVQRLWPQHWHWKNSTGIHYHSITVMVLLVLKYYITKIAYNYSQLPHDRSLVHEMNLAQ